MLMRRRDRHSEQSMLRLLVALHALHRSAALQSQCDGSSDEPVNCLNGRCTCLCTACRTSVRTSVHMSRRVPMHMSIQMFKHATIMATRVEKCMHFATDETG